jgi:hypothetical protein
MTTPDAEPDLAALDDDQLISQRAALRTRLERLPQHARKRTALAQQYDALTSEYDRRARADWQPAENSTRNYNEGNHYDGCWRGNGPRS